MGRILQTFGLEPKPQLQAQSAPQVLGEYSPYAMPFQYAFIGRSEAISVPALMRCRNLLCGTIGAIPLELYKKSTNEELGSPAWLEQPSYSQPRSVTIAWTVDSLLFYGQAFWKVVEVYSEDGRPSRFEWIANHRVTATLDSTNTFVKSYAVDGTTLPMDGLGSLVTFQSLGDGIAEMRRICTIGTGNKVVRNEIVDDRQFADFCPDPEPHTFFGMCPADVVMDIQEIKSNVQRGILDSLAQAIHPRTAIVEGQANLEDVLNTEVGAVGWGITQINELCATARCGR